MSKQSSEIITPDYLFNQMHGEDGKSGKASEIATEVLGVIDPEDHNDIGEYARIALVTGTAAVRKSRSWPEAREHLLRALEVFDQHYPFSSTEEEAQSRGNNWEVFYGDQSAQLNALCDVFHLATLLSKIVRTEELAKYVAGLENLLFNLANESDERAPMIFLIEGADYSLASKTFDQFMELYGLGSENHDPNRIVTVCARFLGRAVDNLDIFQARKSALILRQTLQAHKNLLPAAFRQSAVNLVKDLRGGWIDDKYKRWSRATKSPKNQEDSEKNAVLGSRVKKLTEAVFLGVGEDGVEDIRVNTDNRLNRKI